MRIYVSIIRSTLAYGCEACTTTTVTERRPEIFENGEISVTRIPMGSWRRRYNKELS